MNGRTVASGKGRWLAILLAAAALVFFAAGCYRATRGAKPTTTPAPAESGPSRTDEARTESPGPTPSTPQTDASPGGVPTTVPTDSVPEPGGETPQAELPPGSPTPHAEEPSPEKDPSSAASRPQEEKAEGKAGSGEGKTVASLPAPSPDARGKGNGKAPPAGVPKHPSGVPEEENRAKVVVARLPEDRAFSRDGPIWARTKEELVYKVEFLGITMGYARFSFQGKVILSGKEAYHLQVRAWTSDLLAIIYPVDDTIDYYLDVETLAPLRQEYTRSRKEDDVAIYDQEKGTIVYRYRKNGKVRKKVDAVPNVYDPVSVAYYYRSRELKDEEKGQPMYAGRKLWEISAKPVGFERIRTDRGEFDTIIIRPVLRREGKVEDKGDLKMWMTRDERHVPVRVYAKFKKIRTWTLVGELLPDRQEG